MNESGKFIGLIGYIKSSRNLEWIYSTVYTSESKVQDFIGYLSKQFDYCQRPIIVSCTRKESIRLNRIVKRKVSILNLKK